MWGSEVEPIARERDCHTTFAEATEGACKGSGGRNRRLGLDGDDAMIVQKQLTAAMRSGATLALEVRGADVDLQPGESEGATASLASGPPPTDRRRVN